MAGMAPLCSPLYGSALPLPVPPLHGTGSLARRSYYLRLQNRLGGGDRFRHPTKHCSPISRGPKNSKKGTQRGPNFELKGDLEDVKGDAKFKFLELFTKIEYVKLVKKPN